MASIVQDLSIEVDAVIEEAIKDRAFPGGSLVILSNGSVVYSKAYGNLFYESKQPVTLDTIFDVASLTKAVVTTSSIMKLYEEKKLSLDDTLGKYFPDACSEEQNITVRQLLAHQSGLAADIPLWVREKDFQSLGTQDQRKKIWDYILNHGMQESPSEKTVYSDLGFILLGEIVRKSSGVALDDYFSENFSKPLQLQRTVFCPLQHGFAKDEIAPTELDDYFRHRQIQGSVHDEKADILDGRTGHAGLFSTASDLAIFMQMLLADGEYLGRRYLQKETIALFTRFEEGSKYALGWCGEMPRQEEGAMKFSKGSYGHLGFTGGAIWVDPAKQLCVIFLNNRVYPTRDNIKIRAVRRQLAKSALSAFSS